MSSQPVEKEAGPPNGDNPTPPPVAAAAGNSQVKKREYKDFGHEEEKATRTLLSCSCDLDFN